MRGASEEDDSPRHASLTKNVRDSTERVDVSGSHERKVKWNNGKTSQSSYSIKYGDLQVKNQHMQKTLKQLAQSVEENENIKQTQANFLLAQT